MSARITGLRIQKGYTNHEAFAEENEITKSQYWKWESGYNITWKTIKRICSIHKIKIKEFFSEGFDNALNKI